MMCGRYVITTDPADLEERFEADFHPARPETFARYDVRPTQRVPVVSVAARDKRLVTHLAWGLIPNDETEGDTPRKHFNARAETLDHYACFRDSFRQRRCLMPADGFYEWAADVRHLFKTDGEPMAFAAIWDQWPVDGSVYFGCTLITTEPNSVAARVHDRMPVILTHTDWAEWLNPETPVAQLKPLLRPYAGALSLTKVTDPADDRTPPDALPDDYVAPPKPVRCAARAGNNRRVRGDCVERAA